ncbi:NAD(P)-dependent malic enzyme [Desulfofundulus thermocisternus]|uniref:NAD(P)-dependent malic enzyme n=1 Tax=Desulfofundulus thermocisternus TaxID=42471 RepID=UPI00048A0291|nr:malic enzyme-like NAD(P)-binding protein [Desulfofundulus thermocisternus]MBE3586912.1 NAD-dependent malic enzyme [Thermoanaerobacter sp.]MCS5695396.1 NAD-dependent malic enzyme [Desulfofundulus thermocisternus]
MTLNEEAVEMHRKFHGKIEVGGKVSIDNEHDLSLAYTPGVAEPCRQIYAQKDLVYEYTAKGNLVAIVSDGTAVLGLGDIGPEAALPVMEGKALLFKQLAGVDAFPICVGSRDIDKIVETVKMLEPTFGGINLEDIAAPACFEIERRLKKEVNIPVFHDDQHGTAVVVAAGLLNALKVVGKGMGEIRVVINGCGAAGIATANLLHYLGVRDMVLCDSRGVIYRGRGGLNKYKEEVACRTNPREIKGQLADALKGADVFIGVSKPNLVTKEMIRGMAPGAIVFALANPEPEIMPGAALEAGAAVVATGRSDFPNQINNVLAFPGIFRGALDVRATDINEAMKVAAARAIAGLVAPGELGPGYIIPKPFDPRVAPAVAAAVAEAAMQTGVARLKVDPEQVARHTRELTARHSHHLTELKAS